MHETSGLTPEREEKIRLWLKGIGVSIDSGSGSELLVEIDRLRSVVRLAASMSIGTPDVLACKEAAQEALGGEDRG